MIKRMNVFVVSPSKKLILIAIGILVVMLSWATTTQADTSATLIVTVSDFTFSPDPITINEGDTIQWDYAGGGGAHNIVSGETPTTFRCADGCDGSGGDGTPSSSAWTSSLTFATGSAGTYTYYCEIHGAADGTGMAGSIVILGAETAISLSDTVIQPKLSGIAMLGFALLAVILGSAGLLVALKAQR